MLSVFCRPSLLRANSLHGKAPLQGSVPIFVNFTQSIMWQFCWQHCLTGPVAQQASLMTPLPAVFAARFPVGYTNQCISLCVWTSWSISAYETRYKRHDIRVFLIGSVPKDYN
jgi:hypothetical protein